VTYVAFVPKDKSAEERARTDKSWQRAVARGWTIRTFPGGHVAQQEDPRGVATLMEEAVGDVNRPVGAVGKQRASPPENDGILPRNPPSML
jgi:surfactin synthase thioesterase subunit